MPDDFSDARQLDLAITKAKSLLEKVTSDMADLARHPPAVLPEQFESGQAAMEGVVAALTKLVASLTAARQIAIGLDRDNGLEQGSERS